MQRLEESDFVDKSARKKEREEQGLLLEDNNVQKSLRLSDQSCESAKSADSIYLAVQKGEESSQKSIQISENASC